MATARSGVSSRSVAVDVRAEDGGMVGDLAGGGEAVDLEAAAVGEDRAVPVHEAMQAAHLGDEVVAGAEGEVIGVAEDHAGAGRFELVGRQALDGGLGADGHEDRRIDGAVRRVQTAAAGGAVGGQDLEANGHEGAADYVPG